MIEIQNEEVISFADATLRLPRRRKGKRPHVATLYRWAQHGVRGIRLEVIQVGGTMCTSLEAIQRFFNRLTDPDTPTTQLTRTRKREIEQADRELERAGI